MKLDVLSGLAELQVAWPTSWTATAMDVPPARAG